MARQMIENSERGITLNKGLAWTMASGLLLAGLWLGIQMTELRTAISELGTRQSEDRVAIQDNRNVINEMRRTEVRFDQRLISIEQSLSRTEQNVNEILRYLRNSNGTFAGP